MTWPRLLLQAVEVHGAGVVWATGLDALGYPPTWAHSFKEVDLVLKAIKET